MKGTLLQHKEIAPDELKENVFSLIGADWMLVTAGPPSSFNTMTASWGGLGVLWNKDVSFVFVRPTRHTYGFMEKGDAFTLCFFDEKYRAALEFCGTRSGRDVNKAKEAGLTPLRGNSGAAFFAEARIVIECRKLYFQDIVPARFVDPSLAGHYPKKDYHRMYVGEILRCLVR